MTDSGGIQEETTILGVPCMTLRKSTERPVTITEGTNRLCALSVGDIVRVYREIMDGGRVGGRVPKFWDGKAAERIATVISNCL
jgi:UDP-N-acetylglucosamine 2-epimerase (non-hydrolysing)